jgi:hypothetical protein
MAGTRVKILGDLENWASDDAAPKVCWLSGMAGIGKSSIALTLSERLDEKHMLGASFFCSHSSDPSSDARRIVPTIAHMLCQKSPPLKSLLLKVLEDQRDMAFDWPLEQFRLLLAQPLQGPVAKSLKTYTVVIINAIDECSDLAIVASLIDAVCRSEMWGAYMHLQGQSQLFTVFYFVFPSFLFSPYAFSLSLCL